MLTKAGNTKNTANEAEIEEKLKLAYQDYYLGQHTEAGYTFQNAVDKMFGEGVATVTESNDVYKVTFTNGKKYTFNALTKEVAELEEIWTQNGTTVTNTKTGKTYDVGDIVEYDSRSSSYQGEWAILGAEDGKLLIMSKEGVGQVTLSGKEGYLNGSTLLNNACSQFKNTAYADSVRSVKVEDINRVTVFDENTVETQTYEYTTGTFCHIDGRKLPDDSPISVTSNAVTYELKEKLTSGSKAYNLLNDNGENYWIDTPYVYSSPDGASWGFRILTGGMVYSNESLWASNEHSYVVGKYVRAVVSLKSNIKLSGSSSEGWTLQQ